MALYRMEQEDREGLLTIIGFEVWRARKAARESGGSPDIQEDNHMRHFSGDGEAITRLQKFRVG